ncbi:hypothetical protein [Methylobacterium sp. CM6257]
MLRLLGTLSPTALMVVGAVVAGLPLASGGYFIGKFVARHDGNAAGRAAIVETVNKRNAEAAQVARGAQNDIEACFNAGGEWLQEVGKCAK